MTPLGDVFASRKVKAAAREFHSLEQRILQRLLLTSSGSAGGTHHLIHACHFEWIRRFAPGVAYLCKKPPRDRPFVG